MNRAGKVLSIVNIILWLYVAIIMTMNHFHHQ